MRVATILALLVSLAGCSSSGPPRIQGDEYVLRYGRIVDVRREALPSAAPAGAIVGGFTGLALSRNRTVGSQVASGVGGAALGALASRALEGDRLGYAYEIAFTDGQRSRFVTEKGFLRTGDCVVVERSQHANVRRVDQGRCSGEIAASRTDMDNARQCHDAKDQLLAAVTDAEVAAAARKVELICQFGG